MAASNRERRDTLLALALAARRRRPASPRGAETKRKAAKHEPETARGAPKHR